MMRLIPPSIACLLLNAAPLFAQAPEPAPENKPWLTAVVAVLLCAFVVAVSIKNAKRETRQ